MKKKCYIGIVMMLLAGSMQGSIPSHLYREATEEDVMKLNLSLEIGMLEKLDSYGWWDVIAVTPTNLILRPIPDAPGFRVYDMSRIHPDLEDEPLWLRRRTYPVDIPFFREVGDYLENGEDIIFTPDRVMEIERPEMWPLVFTPVTFKNKAVGFRLTQELNWYWLIPPLKATYAKYLALGDPPVEMTEDDVETILDWKPNEDGVYAGGWKTYEEYKLATKSNTDDVGHPTPGVEPAPPDKPDTPPDKPGNGGTGTAPPVTQPEPRQPNLWLFVAIGAFLFLCAIVFLMRKKKSA